RLWDRLRERIDRPSRAVSLPGFGCRRPAGFAAGEDDYTGWLAAELAAIGEPIDLVGHDWGALLTYRLAADPAMSPWLRSWVGDVANGVHPDYVWHDLARIWQTPGDGEAFFRD